MTLPKVMKAMVTMGASVYRFRIGDRVITDGWFGDADDPDDMTKTGYFDSKRGGDAQISFIAQKHTGNIVETS